MRGLFEPKARGPGRAILSGSFTTVGSGNPTAVKGRGFTVVRDGAGLYTVTYDDAVRAFDAIITGIAVETPGTPLSTFVDQDTITSTAFQIEIVDTATAGTPTDDAGSEVSWIISARISSVSDPQP